MRAKPLLLLLCVFWTRIFTVPSTFILNFTQVEGDHVRSPQSTSNGGPISTADNDLQKSIPSPNTAVMATSNATPYPAKPIREVYIMSILLNIIDIIIVMY